MSEVIHGMPGTQELTDDDLGRIRETFYKEVVPKLQSLDARLGNINCSFAGDKYRNWVLTFRSSGSEFEIVEIEYDPEADTFDLDL
jgi:hypothetical protein